MKITPTTVLPAYRDLYNLSKAELKEVAQHFGINIKGTKDDFIDAVKDRVEAHNVRAREQIEKETAENEARAQQLLEDARTDFEANKPFVFEIIISVDQFVEDERHYIQRFTDDVMKHGVSHAIRHHSERALQAEMKIQEYMSLRRFLMRDDITYAQKLDGIQSQRDCSLNRLTETSDSDQLKQYQFSYKLYKHFHSVLSADKVDLKHLSFFFN